MSLLIAINYLGSIGFIGTLLSLLIPGVRSATWKYIVGRIQLSFDEKLERIRSDLRQAEQKLESELQRNNAQLDKIAQTVLSVRSNRQTALDARRLVAIERLWATKAKADYAKFSAQAISNIKMDVAIKRTARESALQNFFRDF